MNKFLTIKIFISFIVLFVIAEEGFAKCGAHKVYYCQNVKFESKLEPVSLPLFKEESSYCEGNVSFSADEGVQNLKVIIGEKGECPEEGASMLGTVSPLCQDTGRWTNADYVLFPVSQDYCRVTQAEKLEEVKKRSLEIKIGMTQKDVEKIFSDIDNFKWELKAIIYYEYPDVLIEIPYDDNYLVNGEVKVYKGTPSLRSYTPWQPVWNKS